MNRIDPSLIVPPPPAPPRDYGLEERVQAAAVLLATMYPSQVAARLVATYGCGHSTAYDYIARARAFLAGLQCQDRETIFHETDDQLKSIIMNPAVSPQDKLKALHLRIGLHGLRRQPARERDEQAPLFDQEE
jgi:hypothetical protein